ncbi:MAG: SDR family oxidoreductase [Chloroflexi bacterium]|nr:SDR family oxidoreductase [Chloroflexota bacterium]MBK8935654.1 SDR family oxidoreductase [Chloroflexota bacterium]MBP6804793.1 SDR family oxidoreductase [Chloroflexota bacterium]MBP7593161.1 SDR family oxidoreductase [Chloroflexota bacterium]
MRVLVTGHNGYVGTIMMPLLIAANHEVVGLDTNLYEGSTFGEDPKRDFLEINKDVRDVEMADLEGIEAIIHLAGLSNDPLGDLNPELTYDINHRASVRLAEMAKQIGIERFIFSSSCSNYGAGVTDWLDETSAFNPVTPYGRSKVMVEQDVSKLADDNFSPTFLRSGTAYGVSPRLRFDLVLNNLAAWAFTTGLVYLKSDGTPWRPIVHIEDMSRAFLAALEAPRELIHNEAFNVGRSSENYQIRQIAQIVAETIPGSRVEFAEGASADKRNYRVNCDKIINTLPGYKPQWTAQKGAQELYAAYQKVGLELDEFEGPRYRRLQHIKSLMASGRLSENLRWRQTDPAL